MMGTTNTQASMFHCISVARLGRVTSP